MPAKENHYEVQRSLGRIEGSLIEIKADIKLMRDDHAGLRSEFQKLEAGRFTRLESSFAISEAQMHIKTKNTAMIYSVVSAIIISVVTAVVINFLKL